MDIPTIDSIRIKKELTHNESIPEEPSIVDFDDFNLGNKCIKLFNEHTNLILKIRSAQYSMETMVEKIEEILYPLIMTSKNTQKINEFKPDISQKVSRMDNPKNIGSLDTFDEFVQEYNEGIAKEAEKIINQVMKSLVDTKQLELFIEMDLLNKQIIILNYINDINKLINIKKNIYELCPILKEKIMKDKFIYADYEKLLLPIDIKTGFIWIVKVFRNLPGESIKRCNELQIEYSKYKKLKNEIIKEQALKNKNGGFSKLKEKMGD